MRRPSGATIATIVMTVTGAGIPAKIATGIATATTTARNGAANNGITSARNCVASVETTTAVVGNGIGIAIVAMTTTAIPAGAKG